MSHDVSCPSCGQLHRLGKEHYGIDLFCSRCGDPFHFTPPPSAADLACQQRALDGERLLQQIEESRLNKEKEQRLKRKTEAKADRRREKELAKQQRAQQLVIRRNDELAAQAAESKQDYYRSLHGGGCPRCGSCHLYQKRCTPGVAWGLLVSGLIFAICTWGLSLILCLISLFVTERRAKCRKCGWTWRI